MRSHLALVVVAALTCAACSRHLQTAQPRPCPAPAGHGSTVGGIGIIGMSLDQYAGASGAPELFVDRVVPEGPAAAAGVRPGDRVFVIEGAATAGMSIAEAARRLRGPTGASVTLKVGSDGRARDVTITRVAPSDLWSRRDPGHADAERVRASDVAPAAAVAVPPCRQ